MEKDKAITDVLDRLKLVTDFHLVEVVDYWDVDTCAIGLKRGDKLVYINAFNPDAKYDYDFEFVDAWDTEGLNVIKEGRGVPVDMMIREIKEFLGV